MALADSRAREVAEVSALINRTRDVLAQLHVITSMSDSPIAHGHELVRLRGELVDMWEQLGELTRAVQNRVLGTKGRGRAPERLGF